MSTIIKQEIIDNIIKKAYEEIREKEIYGKSKEKAVNDIVEFMKKEVEKNVD